MLIHLYCDLNLADGIFLFLSKPEREKAEARDVLIMISMHDHDHFFGITEMYYSMTFLHLPELIEANLLLQSSLLWEFYDHYCFN